MPVGDAVASSDGERAPVQATVGGFRIVADEVVYWCGRRLLVWWSRLLKGRRCCLGRGSDRRRECGGGSIAGSCGFPRAHASRGRSTGSCANSPPPPRLHAALPPCRPLGSTCACWTGATILEQLCADRGSRPPPPFSSSSGPLLG
jgi:hypothetical protein